MSPDLREEILRIMLADADEIERAPTTAELSAQRARFDPRQCHYAAIQAFWGHYPPLTARREAGDHLFLREEVRKLRLRWPKPPTRRRGR